jgi:hypothetical protein
MSAHSAVIAEYLARYPRQSWASRQPRQKKRARPWLRRSGKREVQVAVDVQPVDSNVVRVALQAPATVDDDGPPLSE